MSDIRIHGCPAPENITLVQRLKPMIGRIVTVFQPGFPRLTRTTGKLTNVSSTSFIVGETQVVIKTSFFIVLNSAVKSVKSFDLTATAEEIGSLKGKLIRVGKDFVEFVQAPETKVPTIFPLNQFTEVNCEHKDGE